MRVLLFCSFILAFFSFRDVYTLDLEAITSYQLGAANDADGLSSGHDALAALPSMPSALELRTALAKLDAGIVRLGERMKVVERAVASGRELASQKVPTTVVDRASQNKATGAPHNKAGPTTERAFQKNSGTAPAVHKSNKRAMTAGTSTVAHVETKPVQKRRLSKT